MRDTSHMPLFPSVEPHRATGGSRPVYHPNSRPNLQHAQGLIVAAAVRRLLAGVVFGLVLVGALWYLMQFNQQTSALAAAHSAEPIPQGVVLVTVNGGDCLWAIAAKYRPNWVGQEDWVQSVATYNMISADAVFPGQVIAIPTYPAGEAA